MFEEPDGEDGEGEQGDEDEQVGAVLSVALLRHPLRGDVVHRDALSADTDRHRQHSRRQQRHRRANTDGESRSDCHRDFCEPVTSVG